MENKWGQMRENLFVNLSLCDENLRREMEDCTHDDTGLGKGSSMRKKSSQETVELPYRENLKRRGRCGTSAGLRTGRNGVITALLI